MPPKAAEWRISVNNSFKKIYYIINTVVFCTLLFGIMLLFFIIPDKQLSTSERRKLATLPEITSKSLLSGTFINELDTYLLDQFPFRDSFRTLKALSEYHVFMRKDNNDVYITNESVGKIEYPLSEESVLNSCSKFNSIYETYCPDSDVYFCPIPDKNYFLAKKHGYLSIDYDYMFSLMQENISPEMTYIDITDTLDISDYYMTDTHWKQENLSDTADRVALALGIYDYLSHNYTEYTINRDFYGVYYGQAALPVAPDKLTYLTNDTLDRASVFNYENNRTTGLYDLELLDKPENMDMYNIFLSGPISLLEINNELAATDKELIIFRDSFGSSIAPLLVEGYKKITLVDIRYMAMPFVARLIDFHGQDVLFMYSTLVLNNSSMLK